MRTLLLLLLLGTHARAARIETATALRDDNWLLCDVRAAELLDPRTRSTIESGLPGSCHYLIELIDAADQVLAQRVLQFALHFDVWEGQYWLQARGERQSYASLADADSAWAHLRSIPLAPLSTLAAGPYRLRVQVDVRPIAAADRSRLTELLSRGANDDEELLIDIGAFFGRLAGGTQRATAWQSAPFLPTQLERAP